MSLKFKNTDEANLYDKLLAYAKKTQETDQPIIAIFYRADGTVNVDRMRELPCFSGFTDL